MTLRCLIEEGVRQGFEDAWTGRCAGRDAPDERCPMRPIDGCACYYRAYTTAPWWRRWRMEQPLRPTQQAVLTALFEQEIRDAVTSKMARRQT